MKVLKFKYNEKEGYLSVYKEGDTVYSISLEDSKVDYIKDHGVIGITLDLKSSEYNDVKCIVSYDSDLVKKIYDKLVEQGNSYFKEITTDMCVLVLDYK